MRSIFTYPNNLATYYIDPDYWSSEIPINQTPPPDGFARRMSDMHTGLQYGGGSPYGMSYNRHSQTVSEQKDGYFSDSEIDSDNLQMYDIWEKPSVVFPTQLTVNEISSIAYSGLSMLDNSYKRDGTYRISNIRVQRDQNDQPMAGMSPWRMPHNTRFRNDWNLTTGNALTTTDWYTSYDYSTSTGEQRLRTAAVAPVPEGQVVNNNWGDWYRFTQSDLEGNQVTIYGSTNWGVGNLTFYPPVVECLADATRSVSMDRILTLTGGTQTMSVLAMDDWNWGRNPNDNNPDDAVNIGEAVTGWGKSAFNALPQSNIPSAELPGTLGGYGNSTGVGQGTVYTEPSPDPAKYWGLRPLYSDSAKTTRYTDSSYLGQAGYRIGGDDVSTTIFNGKIFNSTGGASDSVEEVEIWLGYTDLPSGTSPNPPLPNLSPTVLNNILAYISNFTANSDVNYTAGTVTWRPEMQYYYFPAYVSLTQWVEWNQDIGNVTDNLYAGFDYEKPRMCRLIRQSHTPMGGPTWYSWRVAVGGCPKATYDPGSNTSVITEYPNTIKILSGNADTNGYIQLPKYAAGVKWTHQNNAVNSIPATGNTVTISPNEPARYRLAPTLATYPRVWCGNKSYKKRTGANTYENAAIWNGEWWEVGATSVSSIATDPNMKPPFLNPSQNSGGYLMNIAYGINTDDSYGQNSAGLFTDDGPKLFEIASEPDTYTPPTPTPAELEDQWDTMDEWSSSGYTFPNKIWPENIPPTSATITYNSPTIVNKSQNGIKYTRGSGHTKWRLEVEYPPMTPEDFKEYAAIAQAAHGQSVPFFFKLIGKPDPQTGVPPRILWKDWHQPASTNTPRFLTAGTSGESILHLGGFQSNEADVMGKGEVFIQGNNENGYLHTVLSPQSANIYGEVKIRTSLPMRSNTPLWAKIYKDPFWAVVTLDSDNFEYSTDANGYYYLNVAFDLDDWKG